MLCGQGSNPCFVSPHPSLIARTRRLQLQKPDDVSTLATVKTAFPRQSGLLGFNDGAIFPKSHFAPTASIKKISAAALERTPLRDAIR